MEILKHEERQLTENEAKNFYEHKSHEVCCSFLPLYNVHLRKYYFICSRIACALFVFPCLLRAMQT